MLQRLQLAPLLAPTMVCGGPSPSSQAQRRQHSLTTPRLFPPLQLLELLLRARMLSTSKRWLKPPLAHTPLPPRNTNLTGS